MDMGGELFLKYPASVKSVTVEPAGAMAIKGGAGAAGSWKKYSLQGKLWGRARLTINYNDGLVQTIHYFVTKPEVQALADVGHFLATKQWFVDPQDPFHRSPSFMKRILGIDKPLLDRKS